MLDDITDKKYCFLMILSTMFSVVSEVMKMQSVHHLLEPILEPLIRRVVSLYYWINLLVIISLTFIC